MTFYDVFCAWLDQVTKTTFSLHLCAHTLVVTHTHFTYQTTHLRDTLRKTTPTVPKTLNFLLTNCTNLIIPGIVAKYWRLNWSQASPCPGACCVCAACMPFVGWTVTTVSVIIIYIFFTRLKVTSRWILFFFSKNCANYCGNLSNNK